MVGSPGFMNGVVPDRNVALTSKGNAAPPGDHATINGGTGLISVGTGSTLSGSRSG